MAPLVSMSGITKLFGPVKVLDQVDFSIYPGEVHILAGENGAGKSTLVKILAGAYSDYQGRIVMEGREIRPSSPLDANRHGIAAIHQELSLIPSMSVSDNLFLGHPMTRSGFVREKAHRRNAEEVLGRAGVNVSVNTFVEDLPISVQQLIEITKAIRLNARVLIMDEPSSALNAHDVETLFALVKQLKSQNRGIVYITHRLEEIHRLADRITVFRDGKLVGTAPASELPEKKLIHMMVGREMEEQFPRHTLQKSSEALRVENLSVFKSGWGHRPLVDRVSLSAGRGEILGIGGLQGSGASELFLGLFGAMPKRTVGSVSIEGKPVHIRSPREAISNGVALLTNDRKATGLISPMSVVANMCVASLGKLSPHGWRRPREEERMATEMGRTLQLRASSYDMEVGDLSGGNQQKVAIGKWLSTGPRIMLEGRRLTMKLILKFALCALFLCFLAAMPTFAAGKTYVVGMSQCNLGEPWRVQMNADIKREADKHPEIKMVFKDAQNDVLQQRAQVEEFVSAKIDLLIISPKEAQPLAEPVSKAMAAGIPVIVLDRDIIGENYTEFIGADNVKIGKAVGQWLMKNYGGKGAKVVEIMGLQTSTPGQDRHNGFVDAIKGSDLNVIFRADAKWLEPDARKEMESALARFDKIDIVYGHNDPSAHGAYLAAQAVGREKDMVFVGIDSLPQEGVAYVKQGILNATFQYPTGGDVAIVQALKIFAGQKVEKRIVLGSRLFSKANVDAGGEAIN